MGFIKSLFVSSEINPSNRKARTIPVLNPFDQYGRVFFFSWLGFMVAFLSWYAFPPLLTVTIRNDLHMTQQQVANSNIVALLATFLVRFIAGPLCDRFGPRLVFIGLLLCGSIPTAMAGLVTNPNGLIALRFFIGILGGTFVPCQVWCTGFFDKNIIGTANSLAAGWGNAGGGITYFLMPAIFDSLVHSRGLAPHKAWRVAYVVPFCIIVVLALCMLLTCEDTPTGKWSERHIWMKESAESDGNIISLDSGSPSVRPSGPPSINLPTPPTEKKGVQTPQVVDPEAQAVGEVDVLRTDAVVSPSRREILNVLLSLSTAAVAIPYACSFGSELAINSILGEFYSDNFPHLGQTESGRWAAMFGLLNVVFRPAGGFIADMLYNHTQAVWSKKLFMSFLGIVMGAFLLALGLTDPKSEATMFGLTAGLAFFLEACNGANFAVVPHVHPFANGVVSGAVGGMGNFGGIIFAIIFRYNGTHYARSLWIIGVISIAANLAVAWIRPVPKSQMQRQ
ncbi:MFS transporter [Aspergillus clavatus NRRL 1]|uniref:Nitrate/nitrite transporter n=1 Tax=Aspergillus clavatus (strain ATCC 1007 / CBS 513.65 / DSM 816 / NCTC 3887 / NRRL 1 / QM 1276 / 107) TaxID=344612 RepID=A1CPH7_ASPCL|nr:nitrate transporter CrnA [Aspergillus clavatus NRRL 1]EAW07548.1 nitrate transporter CrnA [Aspergillus clavatus NRRL 1]